MAVLVPDSTRKFPIQQIKYLDLTVDDLFQNMLEFKKANCPDWTDETASDFGIRLLWLFSVLCNWNVANMQAIMKKCFVGLTEDRESMRNLCELIDYQLGSSAAASGIVTFTCTGGHPEFTIPAGTKVGTEETEDQTQLIFETSSAQLVTVGVTSIDVSVTHGETYNEEIIGSSDGNELQEFTISRKPVIFDSEVIEVYDGSWFAWSRVDNFADSIGTSEHYMAIIDEDDNYVIRFGNGTNGKIPVAGTNNIRASYRQGGGVEGNVEANYINQMVSTVTYIESVINNAATSGGSDKETIEHARIFGPASLRALERAVTTQDIETLCNGFISPTYGGIATSKAHETGSVSLSVMIVPKAGGLPSSNLKAELQSYLSAKRMYCTSIIVINPFYQSIDISADIYGLENYAPSQVADSVRRRLVSYIAPNYQDPATGLYPHSFGRNIYLADIYAIIDGTEGVDYCTVLSPTANIIVPNYKIASIGTINLNITIPGTGEVSFQDIMRGGIS